MKWFLLGVCGLAIFIVVNTMGNRPATISPSVSTLQASEQELRVENRLLKEQIARLSSEIAQLKQISHGNTSSQHGETTLSHTSVSVDPTEQTSIPMQMQEFTNFFTQSGDPIAILKASFAQEVVDNSWASAYQHQLEVFFKESFTDVFPQYIECRTTRCKITVPAADSKKFSELSQLLMQGIFDNEKGITKKIVIEPSANDGTLNFYLAKNNEVSFLQ